MESLADKKQEEKESDAALAATSKEKIRSSTSELIAPSLVRPEDTTLQLQATIQQMLKAGIAELLADKGVQLKIVEHSEDASRLAKAISVVREIVKSEFQQALQEMVKIEVAKLMAGIVTTPGTVVMSQSTNALELVIIPTEEDRKDAPRVSITADMGELNQLFDSEDKSSPSSSLHEFAVLNPLRVQQERQSQGEEQVRLGDKEPEYSPRVSEEGAVLDAAVFSAPPAQRQEETPSLEAEIASPPSPQEAVQSPPQSLAESADAAVQSCPAGGGMIEIFLISAKEFTLVSSSRMWNPGGTVTCHYYSGRVYDNVAHKEVQRWSYANLVM